MGSVRASGLGRPVPREGVGLSSALRSRSSLPYLDYATEQVFASGGLLRKAGLRSSPVVCPSPRPPAREPAPSRDHQTGMEKGTQKASSALTSSLRPQAHPSFQLSQGTHRHTMPSWSPFAHRGQTACGGWRARSALLGAPLLGWHGQVRADSPQSTSLLRG